MSEIDEHLLITRALLNELGLNIQTALNVLFAINFTTTFAYPSGDRGETIVLRATSVRFGYNSLFFSFPVMETLDALDVCEDKGAVNKYGVSHHDQLHIAGIEYRGSGVWRLVGEIHSNDGKVILGLEEVYRTEKGTLTVLIIGDK